MNRTIIIGDIHGCHDELIALLKKCERKPSDEVISIGDMVDRGPKPWEVVEFFLGDPNACAILGNHEDKHIQIRQGKFTASHSQFITRNQMGEHYDEAVDYFETLPLWEERGGYHLIHAGALPDVPIPEQEKNVLVRAKMPWMKNVFDKSSPSWWTKYQSEVKVVYGHSIHESPHTENGTVGIDTGCYEGKNLTAFILPEGRFVQVEAKMNYWSDVSRRYQNLWEKERPSPPQKPKQQNGNTPLGRLEIEGILLNGDWVKEQSTETKPGAWVWKALQFLDEMSQKGELQTLEAAKMVVREVLRNRQQ